MNYLNGKLAMKGDAVVHVTAAPDNYAVVGTVQELYERDGTLRISNYPLRVKASKTVLAADAYAAFVAPPAPPVAPPVVPPAPVVVETPPQAPDAPAPVVDTAAAPAAQ